MNTSKPIQSLIFRRDDPKTNVPFSVMRQQSMIVPTIDKMDDVSKIERMLEQPIVYRVGNRRRFSSPFRDG